MTQVGNAQVSLSLNPAQASQQLDRFLSQVKKALTPLTKLTPQLDTSKAMTEVERLAKQSESRLGQITIKPKIKAGDILAATRATLASKPLEIDLKVKPVSSAKINTALAGIQTSKSISIDIIGDPLTMLGKVRREIEGIKSVALGALNVNTNAVTVLVKQLNTQIQQLNAVEQKLRSLRISTGQGGGGAGGGSPGGARGGASGGLSAANTALLRELDQINNAYKRGDLAAGQYAQRLTSLQQQLRLAAAGAAASGQDFGRLDRAITSTAQGLARIKSDAIVKIRADLNGARQAFDAAAAGATNLAQRRAAVAAYERDLALIKTRLQAMGQQGGLTAQQLGSVNVMLGRIAREGNTIRGGINIAGLSGNVANALGPLTSLLSGIGGPLGAAAAGASSLGGGLGSVAAAAGPVGIALGAVALAAAGLVTGLKASIDTAADFEQRLADIRALTQPTADQLERLKTATFDIGKPLGVGANEAASAVLELNKAGLSTAETLQGGLKGALDLAGAAGIKSAEAATLATSAMTAFGLSGQNLPQVADVFANFANKTFLSAQDLSQGIAAVGPVARSAGLDLSQFSGIMATLAQGGFKNMSDAGTSLKTMLLSLQAPTETGAKYLKAIGVDVYDASGKLKPFNQTLGALRDQLVKLTPEAQKRVMKEIFGTDAVRAAQILLTVGPKAINANTDAMRKQGEAARVARERLQSLQGAQRQFSATLEEAKIKLGTPFLNAFAGIVRGATSVVQTLLNLASGAGKTGLAFSQMGQSSRQSLQSLENIIRAVFGNIGAAYNNYLKPVLTVLGQIWSVISVAVNTAMTVIGNVIAGVFRAASGVISGFVSAFTGNTNKVKLNLGSMAGTFSEWAAVARAYLLAVGKVAGELPEAFGNMGRSIGLILGGVGKVFGGFALLAYDTLVKPVLPILKTVSDAFVGVAEVIGTTIVNLVKWVGEKLSPLIDFFKALGLGIADLLGRAMTGIADGVTGLVNGITQKAYAEQMGKQGAAAAEAAGQAAARSSGGFTMMASGVKDVATGVKGLKTAVTDFGTDAAKTFAAVPGELRKAREEAARLQKQLSQPLATGPATGGAANSGQLASGSTTLSQIEDEANAGRKKKGPVTVEDINALEAYRQKLKTLNIEQLQSEVRLQTQRKDTERLRLAIAALNSEKTRLAAQDKRQSAQDERAARQRADFVAHTRTAISALNSLVQAGTATQSQADAQWRKFKEIERQASLLPANQRQGIQALFNQAGALLNVLDGQAKVNAAKKEQAKIDQANAQRSKLVTDTRQAVAQLKLLTDSGKATEKQALSARQRFEDLAAAANKLPEAQRAGLQPLFNQAGALLDLADKQARLNKLKAEQVKIDAQQKKYDGQVKSAAELTRQIDNLAASFNLQATEGKTTEQSLLSFQQRLEGLSERVKALPPELQAQAQASLAAAAALVPLGQEVIAYRAELSKLKESVQGWSFDELNVALARASADPDKVKIIQAEIDKRKQLSAEVLKQAQAEGVLTQARADLSNLEASYQLDLGGAEGNLAQLYAIEVKWGQRLQDQRDKVAQAEGAKNEADIRARYAKLSALDGLSAQDRLAIDAALTAELKANSDAVAAAVLVNAGKKLDAERRAKEALDAELLRVDRSTRATLQQQAIQGLQRVTTGLEQEQARELAAEDLTGQQRYAIRLKYGARLIAAKKLELEQVAALDRQAEDDRYADAVAAAQKNGTLDNVIARTGLTVRQTLLKEHNAIVTGLGQKVTDDLAAYDLQVTEDTNKAKRDSNKETEQARLTDAQDRIKQITEGLDDMTQAGRDAALKTLTELLDTFGKMFGPELSAKALEAINLAINKVKGKTAEAQQDASKLVVSDPQGLKDRAAQDLAAVGKPEDASEAAAKARAQFDSLIDGYKKKIDELKRAIDTMKAIPADKITPAQAQVLAGLNSTLQLYEGFAADAEKEASSAGTKAGNAYSAAAADTAREGLDQIVEAEHDLAEAEGRDGSAAYLAGLAASLAYWRARKDSLDKSSKEYLAALKKVIELEGKVRAEQQQNSSPLAGMGQSFKQGQLDGAKNFNTALNGMAKGMGQALSPMAIFAAILEKINPAGMILEGMFSVLEEPIKALQEPFKTIGTLLGSIIAPVLELLAPILELVAQLFVVLYDAIATFIKAVTFGLVNIDRRDPNKKDSKDAKDPNNLIKLKNQNDLDQLDIDYQKGLIDREKYETEKLKLVKQRIDQERQAELDAIDKTGKSAADIAAERAEVNKKYDIQYQKEADQIFKDSADKRKEAEQQQRDDAQAEADAELAELDNLYAKRLVSDKEYEAQKLVLTLAGLERQRQAEISAAEGNQRRIAAINKKYDALIEKEKLDSIGRLKAAYTSLGDTLLGSISTSIRDGLMASLKQGNFGAFRQGFAKNLKLAMFDAVLSAAIETAAFKAILQPAIDALTDAFASGDQGAVDKALSGLLTAGNKVIAKSKEIYKALRPLRDAWGITEGGDSSQTQTIEVVGNVSAPVMRVSLDMLAYLADSIKAVLPGLVTALQAHTPAVLDHTTKLAAHAPVLAAHTQALPTFTEGVGIFEQATLRGQKTAEQIGLSIDRMGQIVDRYGQFSEAHNQAMNRHAQALLNAQTGTGSSSGTGTGGGFNPKR